MIIGSGLIASAFHRTHTVAKDVCIFASGVANSRCTDKREFQRERVLLESMLRRHSSLLFIYLSTCSVYDPSLKDSPYVKHKSSMEQVVLSRGTALVLRLPQVVGPNANPHTLIKFIADSILHRRKMDRRSVF